MADVDSFSIMTYNCNGLNDQKKRKDVFNLFHEKNMNIYFLQETHLRECDLPYHRASWGYEMFLAGRDTNRGGCAILLNSNFDYKIHYSECDPNGHFIILGLESMNKKFILLNVYGPSSGDNPDFFRSISDKLESLEEELIIAAGDWNCVLDPHLDRKNCITEINRPRTRAAIHDLMAKHNLLDVFRENNKEKQAYTWRRFNSKKQARLDYFLISETLANETKSTEIQPSYRSDHNPVILSLTKSVFKRERMYWKFNNSLLYDREYVQEIKKIITKVKQQYCIPIYNLQNIDIIPNNEITFGISDQLFFETVLLEIRGQTISYATYKKRKENEREKEINTQLHDLEKSFNEVNQVLIDNLKLELQTLREKKLQGVTIRSKVKWIAEGEKVNKYFCNMENRKYVDKSLPIIEREDGTLLTTQSDIKQEIQEFYENLYKEKNTEHIMIENFDCPRLSDDDKESIEGPVTWEELIDTLKSSKPNKSPGPDGYTVEFYKFFINDLGHFLLRSINESFERGMMSISLRQGSITTIPKENKSKKYIKNLRPISLLSVAYKLASGCIANRLKRVLPTIIHESQFGFLAGRQMSTAIRNIYDTLLFSEKHQIPGLMLSIDMEKAFDSVAWPFLFNALEYFNFGPDFIQWIKTLYNNISSCVAVNGQYTDWFPIQRGVRQGDPSSPYLYLICAEVLSLMIRNNRSIKGINLKEKENLLVQFADDTTLCLDGTQESFTAAINTITKFARMSGLKVNQQKTQCIFIGSLKNSNNRYMRDENFVWNPGTWKILGILFSTDTDSIVEKNYENKLHDIKTTLNKWKKRKLTPFGKITVMKSLAISKITHLFVSLPDPKREFLDSLETELFRFLWDYKPNKIKKTILYKDYEKGGLKMCNIKNFLSTLKISMYRKLKNDAILRNFTLNLYPQLENVFRFGSEYCKLSAKEIDNPYWADVLTHLKKMFERCKPESIEELLAEPIFFNCSIVRDHKYIYDRQWVENEVLYINQLLDASGAFLNFNQFCTKFPNIRTNFINFYGIVRAIKRYIEFHSFTLEAFKGSISKTESTIGKGNKTILRLLNDSDSVPAAVTKWNNIFNNLDWNKIFQCIYITTGDVQLRWFQFRLLHRLLPTERYLYLRKLAQDPICNFCDSEEQTICHLFFDCSVSGKFWEELVTDFKAKCNHCSNLRISKEFILFGHTSTFHSDKVFNTVILLAKFFIYKCKLNNTLPNYKNYLTYLKNRYQLEYYLAKVNDRVEQFNSNWYQYMVILQ